MSDADTSLLRLNQMTPELAATELERCCGSKAWCQFMAALRPFVDREQWHQAAESAFNRLQTDDWLEAFSHHPKIGDIKSLRMKYAGNREWSAGEQSGVAETTESTLTELAQGNAEYEAKNGFIFIVCASGKTASEMLGILQSRLSNDRDREIQNAAIEQRKITHLRIDKWEVQA
jgi:2-oxo-4-hydroxy-4-carboxy-5-ureidoimidazoline decarboxylase